VKPHEFQGQLLSLIESHQKVFEADFTRDVELKQRTSMMHHFQRLIITNGMFNQVAGSEEGKRAVEMMTRADLAKPVLEVFSLIDVLKGVAARNDASGQTARRAYDFLTSGNTWSNGPQVDWKNKNSVVKYVREVAETIKKGPVNALEVFQNAYSNIEALKDAVNTEPEEGQAPKWTDEEKRLINGYIKQLEEKKKQVDKALSSQGKTLDQVVNEGKKSWGDWSHWFSIWQSNADTNTAQTRARPAPAR
jgi:hypothetical protein